VGARAHASFSKFHTDLEVELGEGEDGAVDGAGGRALLPHKGGGGRGLVGGRHDIGVPQHLLWLGGGVGLGLVVMHIDP
jgi:hypothetical protein